MGWGWPARPRLPRGGRGAAAGGPPPLNCRAAPPPPSLPPPAGGWGRTPTVHEVGEVHAHIRERLAGSVAEPAGVRILYGGSVKPGNAGELLAIGDVDGALVGGASLVAGDFWAIARSCG